MSLEIELRCKTKEDNDTNDERNREADAESNSHSISKTNSKEQQLLRHLADMESEYGEKLRHLESSLSHATAENDAYDSQIAALRQHNEYLREASTEWHAKYNETKIQLLNAKDEIMRLKSELTAAQTPTLYGENSKNAQTTHLTLPPTQSSTLTPTQLQLQMMNPLDLSDETQQQQQQEQNQRQLRRKLQQYEQEKQQMKAENMAYLERLTASNQQRREARLKYSALSDIRMSLQSDYNEARARISELESIVNDYVLEVRYLEHQNEELRQSVCFCLVCLPRLMYSVSKTFDSVVSAAGCCCRSRL